MDDQNLNTSFDGLFEDRGWIVTNRVKGKIKVSRCTEDEMDNIYMSRRKWIIVQDEEEPPQDTTDYVPNWQLYGTAMFFLRDMLNCETKRNYFICRNIPFIGVLICGTIIDLSVRFDKYAIVVDDGTSSIMCLIKHEELKALRLSEEEERRDEELENAYKENPDDRVLQNNVIMIQATRKLLKNIPTYEDLQLGDIVTIIGTLSEYKGNRYIFIKSIEKEPEDSNFYFLHLKELIWLYTEIYE